MTAPGSAITAMDPDAVAAIALVQRLDFADYAAEVPVHHHRKAQLILAAHGAVTCTVADELWIVPPLCAIWIPGGLPHSVRATANARIDYLFVEPGAVGLPDRCCALETNAMVRAMIDRLTQVAVEAGTDGHIARLCRVMLDELELLPQQRLNLPVSGHPRVRAIAAALIDDPSDRSTLGQWAQRLAIGERSLARLMVAETGLSFGRWRQQLHLVIALRELAGGASVQRVARHLGYESANAFITMFRKATGKTPARYFARRAA